MKSVKQPFAALAAALALAATPALAEADKPAPKPPKEAESKPLGSQQNKMKLCNAEAGRKNLKGEERRAFMSACLRG